MGNAERGTKISPKSGRGLGHVTPTILAVRSAILATAWLLVSKEDKILIKNLRQLNGYTVTLLPVFLENLEPKTWTRAQILTILKRTV